MNVFKRFWEWLDEMDCLDCALYGVLTGGVAMLGVLVAHAVLEAIL